VIFVTVGTTDFDELIRRMDELASELDEEVISQIARGDYQPRHCRYFRFAPSIEDYLARARVVVSHGGLGSIMETIRLGKPLVGVSNPDRRDLHQDDLLGTLEARGHILWCRSLDDLKPSIERAATMRFTRYVEPSCTIQTVIHDFMEHRTADRRNDVFRGVLRRVRS
jgi:beta-1,4-N-acetylglucosaminyltransferase